MKFILALFASLAILGLGQSHQFPDFGKGPLHEDLQDILDLIPTQNIVKVAADYLENDPEVKAVVKYLLTTPLLRNLVIDYEAIPEVINLLEYLQHEGIESYYLINQINRALNITELVPKPTPTPTPTTTPTTTPTPTPTPTPTTATKPTPQPTREPTPEPTPEPKPIFHTYNAIKMRTGGLAGLFKDIRVLLNYDDFITVYVEKLRNSSAFVNLINELKSGNLQQIVNKLHESTSFQIILNGLKNRNVNVKIIGDILYLVFGVTIPNHPKSLEEEFVDFVNLLPMEKIVDVIIKYVNEDKEVHNAILFMFTTEFHDLLRALEALKEHQALVVYIQKSGLNIIQQIQAFHEIIGMEDYVPPKIESFLKSQISAQEVGGGVKALFADIYSLLPLDKIDALYKEKLQTSKVFADYIARVTSPELREIAHNLNDHETYKRFITKSNEKGLDLVGYAILVNRIIGLKF
ncbi:unnamed protein product [Lasius platythorax]|uniref:Protein G12 n=1 Tax=Lasius platythorax TaxID=488582 RepID=A0AAV2NKV1_9HYME